MKQSAIVIIFNADKSKILLVKRCDVPAWVLPGGGVEPNETPEQAALREAWEETGYQVETVRRVAEYTPINRLAHPTFTFECKIVSGTATTGPESSQVEFFSFDNLPKSFFFLHRGWLQDALIYNPRCLYKKLDNVTYLNLFSYFLRHPIHVIRLFLSRLGWPINTR